MPSLANAIIAGNVNAVIQQLQYNDINEIDEYGFRPIIEAAIVNRTDIATLLLEHGADVNQQDATGGSALQWAVENNNLELCELLLKHGANPNTYNLAGQPILAMPMLRQQNALRDLLINAGANITFAQDYMNVKLLGHMFELTGMSGIISPNNEFVEVDFEGFYLEVTLRIISESLSQFQNHFAARQLRRYASLTHLIVEMMQRAAKLIRFQQYQANYKQHQPEIMALLKSQPILIPVAYEGHAITFIAFGDMWVKCDRREDSRLYDNIMFYRIRNRDQLTYGFMQSLMYEKHDGDFINRKIDDILNLEPITELKVDAQISGNCSWANVEACVPAIFFLVMQQMDQNPKSISHFKTLALNYFQRWREWNKDRTLNYCIQAYHEGDVIRKASKAEIMAAILFQCSDMKQPGDRIRAESILNILLNSRFEYLLKNYLRIYFYESNTDKGRHFASMLKDNGYRSLR